VRPAVAFDIGHDQIGAVFGGGSGDVVVGEVGAVLEQHVPGKGMHLVEIVVGAARQCLLFRSFVHAHVHAGVAGGTHFAAQHRDDFALHGGSELCVRDEIFLGEAALLQRFENPFVEIDFRAHLHFAFFWNAPSACGKSKYISLSVFHQVFTRSRSNAPKNQTGSPLAGRKTCTRRSVVVCHSPVK